jgi:hypothetical protein
LMWIPRLVCLTGAVVAAQPEIISVASATKMYFIAFLTLALQQPVKRLDTISA